MGLIYVWLGGEWDLVWGKRRQKNLKIIPISYFFLFDPLPLTKYARTCFRVMRCRVLGVFFWVRRSHSLGSDISIMMWSLMMLGVHQRHTTTLTVQQYSKQQHQLITTWITALLFQSLYWLELLQRHPRVAPAVHVCRVGWRSACRGQIG